MGHTKSEEPRAPDVEQGRTSGPSEQNLSEKPPEAMAEVSSVPNQAPGIGDLNTALLEIEYLRKELETERKARSALETRRAREVALTEKRIKGHLSYRLGQEIVASRSSPLAWIGLPRRLIRAYLAFRRDKPENSQRKMAPATPALVDLYKREGTAGIIRHLKQSDPAASEETLAHELIAVGRALDKAGVEGAEMVLTAEALETHTSTSTLRARFWACHRAADYKSAHDVAEQLWRISEEHNLSLPEQERLDRIFRHPVRQLSIVNLIREPSARTVEPVHGRLCYVLHNSLPHSSGGYATRSHGLASALVEAGWDVVAITRPGFPFDVTTDLSIEDVKPEDQVDRVRYIRLFKPSRRGYSPTQYISLAAEVIETELRRQRPEIVVAASNHLTGLPTLIAARRLGIPFFYEVRGLWEITRLSREPEFEKNINYWLQRELEAAVATKADGVFTLTEAMREELCTRGVPRQQITLLPNSCDATKFTPQKKDPDLQLKLDLPENVPIIGYIGTFVNYEGLDDLAKAAGILKHRGLEFRLLLVGNEDASGIGRGEITQLIEERARRDGFFDWLIMPGRIPHDHVPRYYSLIDITPFPRKPLPVCEMVSPIKPLEALAMGKAVLVSNVQALSEIIRDGETGLQFRKGDVSDLADKLHSLLLDPPLRERLGREGRRWVQEERSWSAAAQRMQNVMRSCIS